MRILWMVLGVFVINSEILAQQDPVAWIRSAWEDSTYKKLGYMAAFRENHPQTLRWLDRIELRSGTREFDLNQQEYGLRMYGSKPAEIRYRNRLESIEARYYQALAEDALHDALAYRYRVLAKLYILEKQNRLRQEQQTFQEKKTAYLEALFQNQLDLELKDLIQAYRKKSRLQTIQAGLARDKTGVNHNISFAGSGDSLVIGDFNWIYAEGIKTVLQQDPDLPPGGSATLVRLRQEKEKLLLEEKRVRGDKWNVLDFVQIQWRNNPNDVLIREKLNIGAGIRLPYSGSSKRDQNQVLIEQLTVDTELDEFEEAFRLTARTLKQEIVQLLLQLEEETNQLNEFEKKFRNASLLSHPLTTPQDALLIEEIILDGLEEILDTEEKLIYKYVDYLDYTRLISHAPYRNYLHAGLVLLGD